MAHFAELDKNNVVLRVVAVHDSEEHLWPIYPFEGVWIKTSYNNNIRKNYAGRGYTYDVNRDAFIPPKPYQSWILNDQTCLWESPVKYPSDGKDYIWDETMQVWMQL